MISLVTASASMIPPTIRERFDVSVVPVTVVVDGEQHREGVDLPVDDFYDRLAEGARVSTAAPSPGEVLARGVGADSAAVAARRVAAEVGSVFVVGVPELAQRGGRFGSV